MHGRVKVKTSAQKEAEREAKKALLVKKFSAAKDRLFELKPKFENNTTTPEEMQELLAITEELCSHQADWSIFWRLRALVLEKLIQQNSANELIKADTNVEEDDKEKSDEEEPHAEILTQLNRELNNTYHLLLQNPKSYAIWAHRRTALNLIKQVNADKGLDVAKIEIGLTEKMLMSRTEKEVENQGRNFHCWDHRRLVLRSNPEIQSDEAKLTAKLISTSFSNFSAWHYRSKLLDLGGDDVFRGEMELVLNAVFTDPSDASSWIYHRWLISNMPESEDNRRILQEHMDALNELQELELEEENNVSILRSISLSLLAIHKTLRLENATESSRTILRNLQEIDSIRSGFYQSQLDLL